MRVAYGDLIGGVSGDMFIAAMIDVGVPLRLLRSELDKVPTLKATIKTSTKEVHAIRARQFHVVCADNERPRSWRQIRRLIVRSKLALPVKETAIAIFTKLAQAEGTIHGVAADEVHFHEIGATDSIVDILAAAIACHECKVDRFFFSPVPLGRGTVNSRHGPLPVPGPATLELLKGLPVTGIDLEGENVTPTGAAIVAVLGAGFGRQPAMTIENVGYGAGEKEWPHRPNLFRVVLGRNAADFSEEEMLVMETNIDDMNPQFYDFVMDRLFAAGARDVFLSPIQMKKNRPAILVQLIAEPRDRPKLAQILFEQTSTIGIRYYEVKRMTLKRSAGTVKTRYGSIRTKIIDQADGVRRITPEYDDLKRIAAARNISLKLLHDEVMRILKR
jgi:pyridinium-3,5-bisthiocarboxylic acid mononucleotide nickel chelatase